jgi:hypothetical protein
VGVKKFQGCLTTPNQYKYSIATKILTNSLQVKLILYKGQNWKNLYYVQTGYVKGSKGRKFCVVEGK